MESYRIPHPILCSPQKLKNVLAAGLVALPGSTIRKRDALQRDVVILWGLAMMSILISALCAIESHCPDLGCHGLHKLLLVQKPWIERRTADCLKKYWQLASKLNDTDSDYII